MIKRFIENYVWFWKESFRFMKGYNKVYIAWGCFIKAIPHCIFMEKWHRMSEEQRNKWYMSEDRFI